MLLATTPAPTTDVSPIAVFFSQYGLLLMLLALIVFMFWSSRRRAKRTKEEQEAKARQMLPGVKVLLQGGLYGTLVEFDADDLSKPARVELAPGVEVEIHSQAVLRVVDEETPVDETSGDDDVDAEEPVVDAATPADDIAPDLDDKPKA